MTRLTLTLPSPTEIAVTKQFRGPARRVFAALTQPRLVTRWWGPESSTWEACEVDLRPGGTWRYSLRDGASSFTLVGDYVEVIEPSRLVMTRRFESQPASASISTITFVERNGQTGMTNLIAHDSSAARDARVDAGMEAGMSTSYARLDALLADPTLDHLF